MSGQPPPVKSISISSTGIAEVLKQQRLAVPKYQREYSWKLKEVNQLLDDLAGAKLERRDYFLGTIVTIGSEGASAALEVVDGQQRLTTVTLILAAIRNHLIKHNSGKSGIIVESIDNDFLSTIDRMKGERVPKLSLNVDDNDFFVSLMSSRGDFISVTPTKVSHRLLLGTATTAATWIAKIAATVGSSDVPDALNDWIEYLSNNANVILLFASNGAQAFKMFETLNDRGLKTSQADLVKSYLFSQSEDRIIESQSRWSSMKDNLEELEDKEAALNFLRHTLIATKKFARADDVYSAIQSEVRGSSESLRFLTELEKLSTLYVATYRPDAAQWSGYSKTSRDAIRHFNMFDVKPIRPLLLAIALRFKPNEFETAIKLLLSISVRLIIASGTRSGTIEQSFAAAAIAVYKNEITTTLQLRKGPLAKIMVPDADFKQEFAKASSSKPSLARYYLHALEAQHAGETESYLVTNTDPAKINLEHVFPKKPQEGTWEHFAGENRQTYVNRIGNLCLMKMTENSDQDNDDFQKKRVLFKDCPIVLTGKIADYEDWSPLNIELRQSALADIAVKTWPY